MIKIIINDTDGVDKIRCLSDICIVVVFISGVLCLFTNLFAFLQWVYDWNIFRFSSATGTLCAGCLYVYRQCQEAINDYYSDKFRKV